MEEYSDQNPRRRSLVSDGTNSRRRDFSLYQSCFQNRPGRFGASTRTGTGHRSHNFLATQHDATVDEPTPDQIYGVGTLGRILQSQKQENGQIKVVVEGRERATTVRVENTDGAFMALVRRAPVVNEEGTRLDALIQKVGQLVEQHLRLAPDTQTDALQTALRNQEPSHLADALASQLRISVEDKQGLLEIFSTQARLQRLIELLETRD